MTGGWLGAGHVTRGDLPACEAHPHRMTSGWPVRGTPRRHPQTFSAKRRRPRDRRGRHADRDYTSAPTHSLGGQGDSGQRRTACRLGSLIKSHKTQHHGPLKLFSVTVLQSSLSVAAADTDEDSITSSKQHQDPNCHLCRFKTKQEKETFRERKCKA